MATATKVSLASVTLGAATSSVTFSGISQSYVDLILIINRGSTVADAGGTLQFNGDTGTTYNYGYMQGNGAGTWRSNRSNNTTYINTGGYTTTGTSITTTTIVNIYNYTSTSTYKSVNYRTNNAGSDANYKGTEFGIGVWRSTSAISSLTYNCDGSTFLAGSTFNLYGII